MPFPEYDEVHVISDLHMGGKVGFQILNETKKLAGYIRWVSEQRPDGQVALVLNGDVIDTLAEESGGYIAVDNAETIIKRIMADPSFAPIWDALAKYVKTGGRTLIITLGNHDLEMSFPVVQRAVIERLSGGDSEARGRIEFSTMGAGYSCLVGGGARVFCTHGNEVDSWNYTRYEELSKAGRRLNSGRSLKPDEWEPNAGTMMVKDVMNTVKVRYPWIDLLKPEMQAAVGVLLALDPSQLEKIHRLIPVIGEKVEGSLEVDQRLSAEGFTSPTGKVSRPVSVDSLLGSSLMAGLRQSPSGNRPTADAMLLAAEKEYKTGSAITDPKDKTLGTGQYLWDRLTSGFTGISKIEALRRALQDWLKNDKTFEITDRDDTCKEIVASVGQDIHFVITGHTHLERAIDLGSSRFYFNCGTWIRLLCFTEEMLADEEDFQPVYDLLANGQMKDIDKAIFDKKPFVLPQQSAVCIRTDKDGTVIGELAHIEGTDSITRTIIKQFTR
jgi:UDP-2,3-diacylglucosamine pyrophosphatase LpxH